MHPQGGLIRKRGLTPRRWRLLAVWTCGLGLTLIIALIGLVAVRAARRALGDLHPPRTTSTANDFLSGLPGAELVSFAASDGTPLAATFVAPHNGAAVVLAHGLGSDRTQMLPEARLLVEHGYGVILFDQRAHGASGGTLSTWGYLEGGDVKAAVDYLQSRTPLAAGHIGLLGFSVGGTAVVRAAVSDPRVAAVVVEADYGSVGDEFRALYSRFGPVSQLPALWAIQAAGIDLSQVEVDRMLTAVQPRPVLLVYGTHDPAVPPSEAERMARAGGQSSTLLMIETTDHGGYMRTAPVKYSAGLLAFLNASLSPDVLS